MVVKMRVTGGAIMGEDGALLPILADKGEQGDSVEGPQGNSGWTPILAGEADGTRTLIKVAEWTGGQGNKPDTGVYLGTSGYVATKAEAFNFNVAKKFGVFSAVTNAQGVAQVSFGSTFSASAASPTVAHWGVPATAVGGVRTSIVANTLSKTGVQIKAEAPSLLGAVLNLLVGATVYVIASEV